jgi:phage baseplate assembly protein W
MSIEVGFPFQLDGRGRVADPDYPAHVEQMIEQVLFTGPGQRVNRPTFGAGVFELVFNSVSEEGAAAAGFLVQAALQRWLGRLIDVEHVSVQTQENRFDIIVRYVLRRRRQRRTVTFAHEFPS